MPYDRMRSLNKHVINRLTRNFAGAPVGPFALMRHVGRRSGKTYETTIMVEHAGDSFVIALTYGSEVDWYRNVLAAGHGTLVWHGRTYALDRPEPVAARDALPLFSPFQRVILRIRGTRQFVRMRYRAVGSQQGR